MISGLSRGASWRPHPNAVAWMPWPQRTVRNNYVGSVDTYNPPVFEFTKANSVEAARFADFEVGHVGWSGPETASEVDYRQAIHCTLGLQGPALGPFPNMGPDSYVSVGFCTTLGVPITAQQNTCVQVRRYFDDDTRWSLVVAWAFSALPVTEIPFTVPRGPVYPANPNLAGRVSLFYDPFRVEDAMFTAVVNGLVRARYGLGPLGLSHPDYTGWTHSDNAHVVLSMFTDNMIAPVSCGGRWSFILHEVFGLDKTGRGEI